MVLSDNRTLRLSYLCTLYFAQGIPWGFVSVTLAAWIVAQGFSADQVGPVIGTATLPWSFKFLWGPVLDTWSHSRTGRRRPWIIAAQIGAIVTLTCLAFWGDPVEAFGNAANTESLWQRLSSSPMALLILAANIFISIQDVATDALAVDLLTESERGRANGFMYASNYAGTAFGGAGLGLVVSYYGLNWGIVGQAIALSGILVLTLLIRERHSDLKWPAWLTPRTCNTDSMNKIHQSPRRMTSLAFRSLVLNLWRAFSSRTTLLGIILALVVKLGIGTLTAVLVSHLIREKVWTDAEYTMLNGGLAVAFGFAGSVLGGILSDVFGAKRMIVGTTLCLAALWMVFGLLPSLQVQKEATAVLLVAQEFLLSVLTVSLFALFMAVSWPAVAATQFTAYMAFMNLSTTIGSFLAGELTQRATLSIILQTAAILQLCSLLPLFLMQPVRDCNEETPQQTSD